MFLDKYYKKSFFSVIGIGLNKENIIIRESDGTIIKITMNGKVQIYTPSGFLDINHEKFFDPVDLENFLIQKFESRKTKTKYFEVPCTDVNDIYVDSFGRLDLQIHYSSYGPFRGSRDFQSLQTKTRTYDRYLDLSSAEKIGVTKEWLDEWSKLLSLSRLYKYDRQKIFKIIKNSPKLNEGIPNDFSRILK